jgi:serine/threonine protein kinase
MHMLKVVHCDIKPSNIMYSRLYDKNVLIDFGVSDVINQEWGEKTMVSFRGTYEYCGSEMKEIFLTKETKLVDLYRNDVEQLVNTLKRISFHAKDALAYEKKKENMKNLIQLDFSKSGVQ